MANQNQNKNNTSKKASDPRKNRLRIIMAVLALIMAIGSILPLFLR